ncbi:hypothetical protein A1OO_04665 [Enterovibrio norvegicus FF-33]|uniref:Uncharacterized protein n=2 Tax=Enterovibrio norvegicus TaxID=188144 RepID=A0A1E5CB64_9GAMM|nr:hypothetical protein A1OK_19395 [Enterovibrio norvegicus FF-454]OEE70071.1 hypothetical protein A1OO_04665 [Enterovibrio norvegicus FF-33]OEE90227.1 hypothetical protein A1OQ_10700 [Enterovibrio norvegicus FF-162]
MKRHWRAGLIGTEMFWADLLVDDRFSDESGSLSQYVVDYRANLKSHLSHTLSHPRVFLLGLREKVRFNYFRRPSYNFFTKKMKFYLLVGAESKQISITVKLADFFFKDLPKPKVILEPHFVTLLKSESENVTLSVHDFLSTVGVDLGFHCDVVAAGSCPSPYWGEEIEEAEALVAFTAEAKQHITKGKDLVVYLNEYQLDADYVAGVNLVSDLSLDNIANVDRGDAETEARDVKTDNAIEEVAGDVTPTIELNQSQLLMLARCFTLYFFGSDKQKAVSIKNADNNLSRFMQRASMTRIWVDHGYESDGEYLRLGSEEVTHSPNHVFSITQEDGELSVDRSNS